MGEASIEKMLRSCIQRSVRCLRRPMARGMASFKEIGEAGTENFRLAGMEGSSQTSWWHDVPLEGSISGTVNMVVEIPRYTLAKMEIDTKGEFNPIKQDVKKGKLRNYHGPLFWNYGAVPQTWEDPNVKHHEVGMFGDNDPLDVVEIGSSTLNFGDVAEVKPLGVLSMIDDGELDWKLIAISAADPLYSQLNSVSDIEELCPGTVSGIREWFRWYKTPDGKPINAFGHGEACLDAPIAMEVIQETHQFWKDLRAGKADPGKLWV